MIGVRKIRGSGFISGAIWPMAPEGKKPFRFQRFGGYTVRATSLLCLAGLALAALLTPAKSMASAPVVSSCFIDVKRPAHLLVVDKSTQRLHLFRYEAKTRQMRLVKTYPCATGENKGNKRLEGDRKTPEGIYFFTRVYIDNKITIFGDRAWHMNFPNPVDRLENRQGNGIYIHGTNRKLKARSTKGCITMTVKDLGEVSQYIMLHRTPIIVADRLSSPPRFDDSGSCAVLSRLKAENYKQFIARRRLALAPARETRPSFSRTDVPGLGQVLIKRIKDGKVTSKGLRLIRYRRQVVLLFEQELSLGGNHRLTVLRRVTFLRKNGRLRALASEWRPVDDKTLARLGRQMAPVAVSSIPTKADKEAEKVVRRMVVDWGGAWQAKDLARYISYYDARFHAQGRGLAAWRRHKAGLNRRYKRISVGLSNLRVKVRGDRAVASFIQDYRSSYFRSRGLKTLILVKRRDGWKIYRENFRRR